MYEAKQRGCECEELLVIAPPYVIVVLCESKLYLRKFILLLFLSQVSPLQCSASAGHLEICRLLIEWNADVSATDWCCFSFLSPHLSLTSCVAAMAALHSNRPSARAKPHVSPRVWQALSATALPSHTPHLSLTHSLHCSPGKTTLQLAIIQSRVDVEAYLRSIVAPQ